ncbi:mitoferrin-2 isoform X1 [Lates japonicus]|uniref:Mitoferrin-2 isoform X1 n=1 Tax=Lates japonicus TaxID=270547 RepID=A0AAD3N5R1_LATJO|nr:mitoferrin-2 isoform X1 [Lates japonicus]
MRDSPIVLYSLTTKRGKDLALVTNQSELPPRGLRCGSVCMCPPRPALRGSAWEGLRCGGNGVGGKDPRHRNHPGESDGFVRRRRMTAETTGTDPGVAGASAGAEVRWLGGRFWGVSESIVGSLTPRIGGETELQTVDFIRSAQDAETEDSEPDYEGLPQGASTSTHMLAGAVAGIMEHCLMFPIDCVKTRMQSLQPDPAARYRNVMDALRRIVATEGVWRPMRGLNATAVGAGPAHALYFASYEKLKKTLSDVIHPGANSHLANGAAGCVATLLHDAAMNPAEVVKQRMQMYNSTLPWCVDCIHFMTYEYLQELLNPHRQCNRPTCCGLWLSRQKPSVPPRLDACKTLLNTQESIAPQHPAFWSWPRQGQGAHRHTPGLGPCLPGQFTGWAVLQGFMSSRQGSFTRCPPQPSAGRMVLLGMTHQAPALGQETAHGG